MPIQVIISYHITSYWVCEVAKSLNHNNYQLGQFLSFIIQMNSWIKGVEMSEVCVLRRSTTWVSKRVCSRSCKMLKAPESMGSTCWLLRRVFRCDSTHWSTRIRTRIALPLVRVSDRPVEGWGWGHILEEISIVINRPKVIKVECQLEKSGRLASKAVQIDEPSYHAFDQAQNTNL